MSIRFKSIPSAFVCPIAFYDDAENDVEVYIETQLGSGTAHIISGGSISSPDSSIGGSAYTNRDWVRVKAVINGANSSIQIEDDIETGELDVNSISGRIQACMANSSVAHWQLINGLVSSGDHDRMWEYLGRIKSWLPRYSSSVVVPGDNVWYKAFPGVDVDTSTDPQTIIATYMKATGHTDPADGVAAIVTSTDGGITWTEEAVLYEAVSGETFGVREPVPKVLSTGRWIVSLCECESSVVVGRIGISKTIYSDDNGETWSSPATLTPPTVMGPLTPCVCKVVELPSGDLLMAIYGVPAGGDYNIALVFRSTNQGASWSEDSTVSIPLIGVTEPTLLLLGNGKLLMFIRGDNYRTWRSVAADSTATPLAWSEPASVTGGRAVPHACELSNGTIVLCTRDTGNYFVETGGMPMMIYTSKDEGVTWSTPICPEPTDEAFMYGCPIEYNSKPYVLFAQHGYEKIFWRNLSGLIS